VATETFRAPATEAEAQALSAKSVLDLAIEATPQSGFMFQPKSYDDIRAFATTIANSDLAPKDYKGKVDNCIIAMQLGAELGLKPMQAIQNIAVINGRPAVWGDAMLALVQASKLLEDFQEAPILDDKGNVVGYTCTAVRKGRPTPIVQTFTLAMAIKANLWSKEGPWTNYPGRMFQMRARSWCLRDGFADVLKGLTTIEEAMDIDDVVALPIRGTEAAPFQMPRRASEAIPPPATTATPEQVKAPPPPAVGEAVTIDQVSETSGVKKKEVIDEKTKKKTVQEKPWKRFAIRTGDGRVFVTFDTKKADLAYVLKEESAVALITFHAVEGRPEPLLDSIMRAPIGPPDAPASDPDTDFP